MNQTKLFFLLSIRHQDHWEHVPEKVPELIVPDLTGFELKPYVSYAAEPTEQVILFFKILEASSRDLQAKCHC